MKLTPVINISRYVTIDRFVIVAVDRAKELVGVYANPPSVQRERTVWGTCFVDSPDYVREGGTLRSVLKNIAPRRMVIAAAEAAPERFAEMVAAAHRAGRLLTPGSLAREVVSERVADVDRYCGISLSARSLQFHTLELADPFGRKGRTPGMHCWTMSFENLSVKRRLVEAVQFR